MTYFFIFLLQTLLPTALLLGCSWSAYERIKLKSLTWLTLLGIITGILLAAVLPNSQSVNLTLTAVTIGCLLLFYGCQFISSVRINTFWHTILTIIVGLQWAKDPNISAITGTDVINTDFILNLSAVVLGVIFCIFCAAWLYILFQQYKTEKKPTALRLSLISVILLLMLIPLSGELLLTLMKLQVLELTKPRLSFVAKASSLVTYFNYIQAAVLCALIALFSLRVHRLRRQRMNAENHPIEKRKKTAHYRHSARTVLWGVAALFIILAGQLYWDKIASQPPRLSEAIALKLDAQEQLHIPIEQVKDGKLHRFVWIADDGKAVRFFVINRQPDRLSLAVVFDACLLCGDQGYVMQDGQVVCIGCGVRMFIPSIGKPGGCNPVPIENWQQTDIDILVHKSDLEQGLNLFSTIVEIEVTDPINGAKLTNTKTEHKYSYEGKTYFFSDEKNLDLFRDNPENYLQENK